MRPATPIWSTPIGWTNGPPPVPPMRCSMTRRPGQRRGGSRCSAAVASPAPTTRSWPWPSGSRPRWATRCGARNGSSTTTPMTSACRGCSATAPATRRCTPATCWCCWGPTSRTCSSCRPSRRSCRSTSGVSGSGAGLGWTWGCGGTSRRRSGRCYPASPKSRTAPSWSRCWVATASWSGGCGHMPRCADAGPSIPSTSPPLTSWPTTTPSSPSTPACAPCGRRG